MAWHTPAKSRAWLCEWYPLHTCARMVTGYRETLPSPTAYAVSWHVVCGAFPTIPRAITYTVMFGRPKRANLRTHRSCWCWDVTARCALGSAVRASHWAWYSASPALRPPPVMPLPFPAPALPVSGSSSCGRRGFLSLWPPMPWRSRRMSLRLPCGPDGYRARS